MKRIMIEHDKCSGCKNCSIACMQAHRADRTGSIYDLGLADPANEARHSILSGRCGEYFPLFCRHCDDPGCASSCMSGAMAKDPLTGHVTYDVNRCAACFMCVMNCSYGVLKPNRLNRTFIIKCDFCSEDNEEPNCVKMCPTGAIYVKEV